ncbi:MAG TPA: alkaline phosphatase [Bacteroidales bacterium]|nr:alkaline phosphatase [Bacteroidales bacterium]
MKTLGIMRKMIILIFFLINAFLSVNAQHSTLNAHAHNDYYNDPPFWLAYNNCFGSIEADIWVVGKELLVAHIKSEINPERTLDSLYIKPAVKVLRQNGGKPWTDRTSTFQLLIDLKTTTEPALSMLIEKLKDYPDVFDPFINETAIRIVITGNRPKPSEFSKYPDFVFFDGMIDRSYDEQQLKRVALFSENLRKFTSWNGEGSIPESDEITVRKVVDSVHALNKKIRFWNAPDVVNAWNTFINLGIDYINTDKIIELSEYLNSQKKN